MNRSARLGACACLLLWCPQVFGATWDTVIFRDDFDLPPGSMPDPEKWIVNHPCSKDNWWRRGRTHLPCAPKPPIPWPGTGFPRIEEVQKGDEKIGVCVVEHHLFNPFDLGTPKTTFLGGEIHTVMEFRPDRAYRFEAKVRWNSDPPYVPHPSGLVTSFFPYGFDGSRGDEIDIEFVSEQINAGNTVSTNTWNEGCQKPLCPCLECPCTPCPWCEGCVESCSCQGDECTAPQSLDLAQWQTFRIYWYPDPRRIEWTWVLNPHTPEEIQIPLREPETDAFYIPDEPMAVYLNFWAPDAGWDCAYDDRLEPKQDASQNEISAYEIDYVEVRTEAQQHPAPQYVDEVVSEWCPCWCGHCATCGVCTCPECCYSPTWRMVGAPDFRAYSPSGRSWAASPADGGEVVVKFSGALVVDGEGNDLRFWQGSGDGSGSSQLWVSRDGVVFHELGLIANSCRTGGDAGPGGEGYYCDFDLGDAGVGAIQYIKIIDLSGDCDASDIDAIEALNCNPVPAVSEWGLVVMTLLGLTAATVVFIRRHPEKG